MVRSISDKSEFDKQLKDAGDRLVAVDFTASWCGPCKQIGPIFVQLSELPEYSTVVFLKVDVDEAEDISVACEIKCMPTFHFYKNGQRVHEFSGCNKEKLVEALNQFK